MNQTNFIDTVMNLFLREHERWVKDVTEDGADSKTPSSLVVDMLLSMLRNITFGVLMSRPRCLDPACGYGTFLVGLFGMLCTLNPSRDPVEIFAESIFGCDIDEGKVKYLRKFFTKLLLNLNSNVSPDTIEEIVAKNISCDDSLTRDWNNMKFDIVVGNPPYNPPSNQGSGKAGSGSKIWQKFLPAAYECLRDGGHVLFVHPTLRNNTSPRCKAAKRIWDSSQLVAIRAGFQFPGPALVWVDYYLLRKRATRSDDQILWINRDGTQYIINREEAYEGCHLSPMTLSILRKVLAGENDLRLRKAMGGLEKNFDSSVIGHFPYAHGAAAAKGEWKYKPHPHDDQDKLKVILVDNHDFRPIIDEGKLGIGDHVHYLIVDNLRQASWFSKFVTSRLSRWLQFVFSEQWNEKAGKNYSWNYPRPLTRIEIRETGEKTDTDFYSLYGLTQEEIDHIEATVK